MQSWLMLPWFVKLAVTVAVVWLLASIATFIISYLGEETGEGSVALAASFV